MSWTKDGRQLWEYVKKFNPTILSSPSIEKESKIGKKIWCERELGLSKNNVIITFQKQKYATSNSILIDDMRKRIVAWKTAGGIGILHTSTEDTV